MVTRLDIVFLVFFPLQSALNSCFSTFVNKMLTVVRKTKYILCILVYPPNPLMLHFACLVTRVWKKGQH